MKQKITIKGGLFLVLDPSIPKTTLLEKLKKALEGGVSLLQIWNNWPDSFQDAEKWELIKAITTIASDFDAPVLINEEWELLKGTALSGVHFDQIPENYETIKATIGRGFIAGITCSNDLKIVDWAERHQLDYVSFCALFPSKSAGECEIVAPDTIKKARTMTQLPLFVSGGITAENLLVLKDLDFAGVAVISGILNNDSPKEAALAYMKTINQLKK